MSIDELIQASEEVHKVDEEIVSDVEERKKPEVRDYTEY